MLINIYSRKSKFTGKGESIENQIDVCKKYIALHIPSAKNEDITIYEDEDFSGKDTNRSQFKKMMNDIKKKKPNYVICYMLDRVSRSVNDFSTLVEYLTSMKINFVSVKEQFDTSTPMGRAMIYITAVFAQLERENLCQRVRDNMLMLSRTGRWLGGTPPIGFDSDAQEIIVNGKIRKSHYLKENKDMELVKLIFQKFIDIGSAFYIARYLSEKGIKTVNKKYFYMKSVSDILKNPTYCTADKESYEYFMGKGSDVCFTQKDFNKGLGISAFNRSDSIARSLNGESKWIIALGKHKGVITGKDWVYVQKIFNERKEAIRNHHTKSLLSGFIKCEVCGGNMLLRFDSRSKDRSNFYYTCSQKVKLGIKICNSKNLNGPKTDEQVINYVMNFDEKKLKKDLNIRKYSRKVNKFKDKSEELHFEILDLKDNQNKYIEHLLKVPPGSPFAKNIQSKVNEIENQIDKLKSQKQTYDSQGELAENEKTDVDKILKNLLFFKENFHTLDYFAKKSLLRLVVSKLTWSGSELKIFLTGEQI